MSRIVFANNYYYPRGGSERVMLDEMRWLGARGHDIIPFARQHERNQPSPFGEFFPPMVDFGELGYIHKPRAALDIIYSRSTKASFAAVLDQCRCDMVHGHNIYGGLTYSIIDAARERSIPFVLTLHDLKLACPSYLMLNRGAICERCGRGAFWNCALQRCHKDSMLASLVNMVEAYFNKTSGKYDWISSFLCPSQFLLDKIAVSGVPRTKLVHLPNAVNTRAYQPSFGKNDYALYAGRLSREKGLLTLLEASKDVPIPLRIAGTGPLEALCKGYVERSGMQHVTFEGYCHGDQLKDLFRNAAFLVIPSECYENAPMSILEAYAYGKPVIGSDLGGTPELVSNNQTGMLVPAGDVRALAEAMATLWHNHKLLEDMGRAARARVEADFSSERHADRLSEIYRNLIH